MTLPTTILGRTLPGARQRSEGHAAAGGSPRSEPDQHRLARGSVDRPELMTDRVAAQICGVSVRMIRLWVETGAWPLPDAVRATPLYFGVSDVKCWLGTARGRPASDSEAETRYFHLQT
jgi:hypothetical protein